MNTMDQELPKNVNPYFAVNFIKPLSNSLSLDKKSISSHKVSDKELAERIYRCVPTVPYKNKS